MGRAHNVGVTTTRSPFQAIVKWHAILRVAKDAGAAALAST
jgi:hypothetical protein